jgi:hypothetical protein
LAGLNELMREYERARYPEDRRLDLHGEGPRVARERALQWIQSRAHESPGDELLLILHRSRRVARTLSPVETAVRDLLDDLTGKLIDWWQPFAPGSVALRIAHAPSLLPTHPGHRRDAGSTTGDESGAETGFVSPLRDIPPELLERARRAAQIRLDREGLSIRLEEVMLREIWIEAQALAMERRVSFEAAVDLLLARELERYQEEA